MRKATQGKIQNLVEEVKKDLVLIMASAALFKGQWKYPFEKKKSSEEVFYNSDGSCVRVEMMNQGIDDLRTAYDAKYNVRLLELPFHGDISLLLIHPHASASAAASQLQRYMITLHIQELLDTYDKRFQKACALTVGIPKVVLQEKVNVLEELRNTELGHHLRKASFSGTLLKTPLHTRTPCLFSEIHFTMDEEGAAVEAASYSPTYGRGQKPLPGIEPKTRR